MKIVELNHAHITIPPGAEAQARAFYCDLLGLEEIEKPDALKPNGGLWCRVGSLRLHIGTEDFAHRSHTKAHVSYTIDDLNAWQVALTKAGVHCKIDIPLPNYTRLKCRDPFGNLIELMQPVA